RARIYRPTVAPIQNSAGCRPLSGPILVTRTASTLALALALAWLSPAAHAQDGRTQDARAQASRDADGPIPQLVKFVGSIMPGSNASEPARRAGREPRASRPSRGVERQALAAQMPAVAMPLPPRRPNEVD